MVKDRINQKEIYHISRDLMDPIKENPKEIMNRFLWMDDHTIRLINKEGIEKIIDLENNFKEIEYNVIPLFDANEFKDPNSHYFKNRSSLAITEVLQRLKRKYQAYKTAYYLEHKREPFSLYNELFTVDY